MSKPADKKASSQAAYHLLMQGISEARVEAHRLRHLSNRALAMVERSEQKDHLYEEAGDVIVGLPARLAALERVLDRTSLALIKMGEDFLAARLPLSEKQLVEDAVEPAFGGGLKKHSETTARVAQRWATIHDLDLESGG